MKHPAFKALIFDMDGLVLDSERTYTRAWKDAAQALGFSLTPTFLQSLFGCHADEVAQRIQTACGPSFDSHLFFKRAEVLWFETIGTFGIPKMPGVIPLLHHLETHDIPFALATNSDRPYADVCLKAAGLSASFPVTVTRDEVAAGKPSPDLFLKAAESLGYPPSECLVLEDSRTGLEAAQRAQIAAILIQRNDTIRDTLSPMALARFKTLDDFLNYALRFGCLRSASSPNL